MIYGIIFGSIFAFIFVFSLILSALIKPILAKKRTKKGVIDENRINNSLLNIAQSNQGTFFKSNVYTYFDQDSQSQKYFEVDGILIKDNVMFVIEIKSIVGSIAGRGNNPKLVVKNSRTYEIDNPIKQNEKHITHISKLIDENFPIFSLIIFSDLQSNVRINILDLPDDVTITKERRLKETLIKKFEEDLIDFKSKNYTDRIERIKNKLNGSVAKGKDLLKFYEITGRFN